MRLARKVARIRTFVPGLVPSLDADTKRSEVAVAGLRRTSATRATPCDDQDHYTRPEARCILPVFQVSAHSRGVAASTLTGMQAFRAPGDSPRRHEE